MTSNMTAAPMSAGSGRGRPSVQAAIEEAVAFAARTCRFAAPDAPIPASTPWGRSPMSIFRRTGPPTGRDALNAHLRCRRSGSHTRVEAAPGFDARFSALRRHYLYRIVSRRAPLALEAGKAWWVPGRSMPRPCIARRRAGRPA